MAFLSRAIAQRLEEVEDICAGVEVAAFEVLEDARVEIFVHFAVFEGIGSGFLGGGQRGG